ncbi:MAG: alpha/beta fold hydrolase [Candidatus Puniceispirillaceae bacterium]
MSALTPLGTAYETFGQKGAPVIVLIHGLGLTRQTWDGFITDLQDDYFVISYDLCGHGQSALPTQKPSLRVLSEQLSELLTHLDVAKAHLIGFSLGGMINRRFAMDYPDKIASLVILNSPHERSAEQQILVEKRALDTQGGGAAATIEATIERWFTSAFRANNLAITAWVRATVLANDPQNYADHRFVLANGVLELIRPEPAISCPALVMTCAHDSGSTVAMSEAIASEIKGAQIVIIPDLQHLGLLEQPASFLTHIKAFLSGAEASSG